MTKFTDSGGWATARRDLDETAQKLLTNYAACYIQIALTLRKPLLDMKEEIDRMQKQLADTTAKAASGQASLLAGKQKEYNEKLDLVISKMNQCVGLMPADWRPRMLRQEFLLNHNRFAEAEARAKEAIGIDPDNPEYQKMLAQALEFEGKRGEANTISRP